MAEIETINGNPIVAEVASESIQPSVDAWLAAHPEVTTTVQDGSITDAKLVQTGGVLEEVHNIRTCLEPILGSSKNLLDLSTLTSGVYINNTNGTEVSYSGWSASDYIPINPFTQYRVLYLSNGSYVRVAGQNLYWAIYDENKGFLRGGIGDGITTTYTNATYLRVSCPTSYFGQKSMVMSDSDASAAATEADYVLHLTTDQLAENVGELVEISNQPVVYTARDAEFVNGFIQYWTGTLDTSGGLASKYLDVKNYQGMLLVVKAGKAVGNYAGLAFYDENELYISGVDYDDAGNVAYNVLSDIRVQVPKNAYYMRATTTSALVNDFAVIVDALSMAENIYKYNPLLVSDDVHWVNYNPHGTRIILSDAWKANAEQAYANMQDYLKATNAYDFASLLIETDSHGRGTLPFNWMQKRDNTVRCCHLGDIVDNQYSTKELQYYYLNTKACNKLITLVGNHDAHYRTGYEQGNQYDLLRYLDSTGRRIADPQGSFSVIDHDQRVEYICLNPYKIITGGETVAITQEQMAWFVGELANAEYDVIVLSHNPINDSNLVDRDGGSGSGHTGGPYAAGYDQINTLLKAFKNRASGRIQSVTYGDIVYDFTNVTVDLICNLAGHTHYELFKTDTYLTYVANWYGNTHCCVFFVADKANKKVALFQFDNNTVYDTLEFDY